MDLARQRRRNACIAAFALIAHASTSFLRSVAEQPVVDFEERVGDRLSERIAGCTNVFFSAIASRPRQFEPVFADDLLGDVDRPLPEIAAIFDPDCVFHALFPVKPATI